MAGPAHHNSYGDLGPSFADLNAGGSGSTHTVNTTTFYTASMRESDLSLATRSTAYYSVEDHAVVKIANTAEFRSAFRDIDVTHLITDIANRPSGLGGSADVKQAYLRGSKVRYQTMTSPHIRSLTSRGRLR